MEQFGIWTSSFWKYLIKYCCDWNWAWPFNQSHPTKRRGPISLNKLTILLIVGVCLNNWDSFPIYLNCKYRGTVIHIVVWHHSALSISDFMLEILNAHACTTLDRHKITSTISDFLKEFSMHGTRSVKDHFESLFIDICLHVCYFWNEEIMSACMFYFYCNLQTRRKRHENLCSCLEKYANGRMNLCVCMLVGCIFKIGEQFFVHREIILHICTQIMDVVLRK